MGKETAPGADGGRGPGPFEPSIIAFTCAWCGYPSAVLAGVNRIEYPPGVNIVRVMCTGMIEPSYVMRALEYGADGVVIVGCQMENCHYTVGNRRAQERSEMLWPLLDMMGMGAGRLRTEWINASERVKFARAMRDFSEQLKKLGPNPLGGAAGGNGGEGAGP